MLKFLREKQFTNGFVAVLELDDGKIIETTATCLPISTEMRGTDKTNNIATDYNNYDEGHWKEKYMIGVSTQTGCPIKCKFCAINKLTEKQGSRNLTTEEILEQVTFAIKHSGHNPEDSQLFRVLFTRAGEPSLNIENVIAAINVLKETYSNIRIQISTIGLKKKAKELIEALVDVQKCFGEHFIELQFSIHSTSDEYRKWLQCENVLDNIKIDQLIEIYRLGLLANNIEPKWKTTLNFALAKETPFDIEELSEQFDSDNVFIKISPINENIVSEENNIKTLFNNQNTI